MKTLLNNAFKKLCASKLYQTRKVAALTNRRISLPQEQTIYALAKVEIIYHKSDIVPPMTRFVVHKFDAKECMNVIMGALVPWFVVSAALKLKCHYDTVLSVRGVWTSALFLEGCTVWCQQMALLCLDWVPCFRARLANVWLPSQTLELRTISNYYSKTMTFSNSIVVPGKFWYMVNTKSLIWSLLTWYFY